MKQGVGCGIPRRVVVRGVWGRQRYDVVVVFAVFYGGDYAWFYGVVSRDIYAKLSQVRGWSLLRQKQSEKATSSKARRLTHVTGRLSPGALVGHGGHWMAVVSRSLVVPAEGRGGGVPSLTP